MAKLTAKERSRYDDAESHLRRRYANAQCMWETTGNNGSPYCVLAGFLLVHSTRPPEMIILAIRRGGTDWEVFGAPRTDSITETFNALNRMWSVEP